jgi:hypothetical protein
MTIMADAKPNPEDAVSLQPRGKVRGRYEYLLVALFLLVVVYPFIAGSELGRMTLTFSLAIIMIAGTLAVSRRRFALITSLVLALPAIASREFYNFQHWEWALQMTLVTATGFMAFNAIVILREVLRHRVVTQHTIYGAICVYVLIGMAFALGYALLEHLYPGSFNLIKDTATSDRDAQLISFSFVTLTTVGYGDITPATPGARALCNFEALLGQLYLAVLIARLVGSYMGKNRGPNAAGK